MAYMGEVLTQVWVKSIDKVVNAQKESLKKLLWFSQLQAPTKVYDENERSKDRKQQTHKVLLMKGSAIDEKKRFIEHIQKQVKKKWSF